MGRKSIVEADEMNEMRRGWRGGARKEGRKEGNELDLNSLTARVRGGRGKERNRERKRKRKGKRRAKSTVLTYVGT